MQMRPTIFAAARRYFAIALVMTALWATSFIAAYLLPAAIVALAAAVIFGAAGYLWPKPLANTSRDKSKPPPTSEKDSTARSSGEQQASSSE